MVFSRTILALAFALVACGQGPMRVNVSGRAQDVRFTVLVAQNGGEACVDRLSVTPLTSQDADPVWQVTAVDPAKCTATLRYGDSTEHFAQAEPAAPLRLGTPYRVRVSGAGFSVVRDFRVMPDHVIEQD